MPSFSSLEWTFIEDTIIPTSCGTRTRITVLGSGPKLYVSVKNVSESGDLKPFELGVQLRVFKKTETWVRGFLDLSNGYALAWGDSYIAHIPVHQLLEGGTVCWKNILSTGRQIIGMRSHTPSIFSIFYADGSVDTLLKTQEIWKSKTCTLRPLKILRLPLKPAEIITAAYTKTSTTYLGTSHGRLIAIKELTLIYKREPVINSLVKQIIRSCWVDGSDNSTVLCFENGSIVAWNKNHWTEVKGRFTAIHFSSFTMVYPIDNHDKYLLAGDMDGNLTVFRVSPGQIVPYRTVRGLALNPITMIGNIGDDVLIGTKMGELQWIDVKSLDGNGHPDSPLPKCVTDSPCSYKTTNGWYFLINNQLWKAFKYISTDGLGAEKFTETYFESKDMKLKYLCCTGQPDREIIFAYGRQGYFARITEYEDNEVIEYSGEHHTPDAIIIIQVILMQSYILVQLDSGIVQLFSIEELLEIGRLEPSSSFTVYGRITAAAFIEKSDSSLDFMVSYLDGRVEIADAGGSQEMITNSLHFAPVPIKIRGKYIVSMISSLSHIGISQCILLSRKGVLYLIDTETFPSDLRCGVIIQQDLGSIIGRGHSLIETVHGILVAGFVQNTLHVCWISLCASYPSQYRHLFSVDTRSSRLPFTVMVDNDNDASFSSGVAVSYHHKDGFKEERFPYLTASIINGFKHSGNITHALIYEQPDENGDLFEQPDDSGTILIISGDTEGRFCTWSVDKENVHGQSYINDFKLDGSITALIAIDDSIAVSTSQGQLHLFNVYSNTPYIVYPHSRYHLRQKISYMLKFEGSLLVFLADGTVQQFKLEDCTLETVANFPAPTKMALCMREEKDYFIMALGNDGILRTSALSSKTTTTADEKTNISFLKGVDINGVKMFLFGTRDGRVYVKRDSAKGKNQFSDNLHSCEIIDVLFYSPTEMECYLCSLDINGVVVIRYTSLNEPPRDPVFWSCPVPSPRKLEIVTCNGVGQILVVGRGAATKSF